MYIYKYTYTRLGSGGVGRKHGAFMLCPPRQVYSTLIPPLKRDTPPCTCVRFARLLPAVDSLRRMSDIYICICPPSSVTPPPHAGTCISMRTHILILCGRNVANSSPNSMRTHT